MTEPTAGRPVSIPVGEWTFDGLEWGPVDGQPVLLLHGFPQHCTSWTAVAARLAEAGLRAVALNQRGYADGARPAEVDQYALPLLVADVVAMIDALAGPDGAVDLVGHDWGGVVGWQVAARHPSRVRTWTALSTPHQLAINEVLAVDAEQRERFRYMSFFRRTGVAEQALLENGAARLRALYGPALPTERVDEDLAFITRPHALTAALNWYRAMSPADAEGMSAVTVPTTYVWGADDPAFGRAAAEGSARFVTGDYRFVPLDGVGHWLPDEAVDTVAEAIAERVLPR